MKMQFVKLVTFLIIITPAVCQAIPITFTSSGAIGTGDIYDYVYLENDGTVVDMTGGQIEDLWLYDESVFNMSGGNIIDGIDAHGSSYFDMSNGTINAGSTIVLYGDGGRFSGGNVTAIVLKTGPFSTTQIDGGVLSFNIFDIHGDITINGGVLTVNSKFYTAADSIIEILGGSLTVNDLSFNQDSTMNIYGRDFNYNSVQKILTGNLLDDSYFSIGGVDQWEYDQINLVPEPTTMLLFALGGLFLRKRS